MNIHEQIRTLSNPVRFEILEVLKRNGKMPASEIIGQISHDLSPSMVSQHLSKLRLNKLVISESMKGRRQYRVNREALSSVVGHMQKLDK
jgi:DNA-binding transcriptional ArsR family regulator